MAERIRTAAPERGADTDRLLDVVRTLVAELHPEGPPVAVTLDSLLERDLGLDSLAIVELAARIESHFGVRVAEALLAEVDTPRDIVRVLSLATPAPGPAAGRAEGAIPLGAATGTMPALATLRTLVEALDAHAAAHPERPQVRVLDDTGEDVVTYGALRQAALAVARGLAATGVEPGEAVSLMLPTGRGYFAAFMGALLAGAVPVPIYPPARPTQLEEHLRRQARILENARAAVLVTVPAALRVARLVRAAVPGLRRVVSVDELVSAGAERDRSERWPRLRASDVALLQYTSGSTGAPKGVVLTHANLLANIRAMGEAAAIAPTDLFVSWLPLYHDMGLIGAWLASVYHGFPLIVMSPTAFLARPERWLRAISDARGTISASPNFGYELCLTRIPDAALAGLDLSSWRLAYNGAEPVSAETLDRFATRFAPFGFRREALTPVYGLAEASVGLAFPPLGRGPRVDRIAREPLVRRGRAETAPDTDPNPLRVVACGRALPGHELRVVDAVGVALEDRREGRIEFRGPSATAGYLDDPDATRRLRHGEWLDTGDLGYLVDGELYVTGRVKDIVIRAGRNLHPDELESAVGALSGVRRGRVAVFAAPDPSSGTERLVVLAETRETEPDARAALRARIVGVTVDLLGTPPDDVVLARPGTVLKTPSGKIRRAASREAYAHGTLDHRRAAPWWQVVRFAASTTAPRARRSGRAVRGALFGLYAWAWLLLVAAWVWPLVMVLPARRARWAVVRAAARFLARVTGVRIGTRGTEQLEGIGPYVAVANHASFVDGLAVALALPGAPTFVVARDVVRGRARRMFVERLGAELVERVGREQSVADAHRLLERARAGASLVVFPEGRLDPMPGLRPFHSGAFVVAAAAGRPVVPVGVRGSRALLAPGRLLPHRATIEVVVGTPFPPDGTGWDSALRLRAQARAAVLAACGELDRSGPAPSETSSTEAS